MKKINLLLSVVLILMLALSSFNVSADVQSGILVGDGTLYLPESGAIRVKYVLTSDGVNPAENAVYSVSVDGVSSDETDAYAVFGTDGYLCIGQNAKGKTLTVSASGSYASADVSAEMKVNVCDKIYAEDFESETAGQIVSSGIFDVKNAEVITEGEMTNPADASNTNKIAKSYTNTSGWYDAETQLAINGNFNSSKLNIEAKVAVHNQSDIGGNFPNMNHILRVKYADGAVYAKLTNTATMQLINRTGDKWLESIYALGASYNTLMPFHMIISDNTIVDMSANGKTMNPKDISGVKGDGNIIETIAFGSYVDDIEIYSGEKCTDVYEICGQDVICRAPEGTDAVFAYSVIPTLGCVEAVDSFVLELKNSHAGVSVSDNKVKVSGNAASGEFVVCAKDSSGNTLAEKTVTVADKIYSYADNYARAFLDFESQTPDTVPSIKLEGRENWIDYVLEFTSGKSNFDGIQIDPVVKEDTTHGKYVSARGFQHWSGNGSNFKIIPRADNNAYMLSGAQCGTLEADFKLDLELMQSVSHYYSLFYVGARDNGGLDIRYTEFPDGTMGIYSFMTKDGYGNSADGGRLIATVPADTWFNLRVEADFVNKTYDLYINNELKEKSSKHSMPYIETFYIGADVDNIAVYHGSKDVETVDNGSVFDGTSAGLKERFVIDEDVNTTVVFNLSEDALGIAEGSSLIVAHYDGNALRKVRIVPVTVCGGKALACAAVSGDFAADDYVRAYVWDFEKLLPIDIEK